VELEVEEAGLDLPQEAMEEPAGIPEEEGEAELRPSTQTLLELEGTELMARASSLRIHFFTGA